MRASHGFVCFSSFDVIYMGVFQNLGYPFGDPLNKHYSILGSIGIPLFRETTMYICIYISLDNSFLNSMRGLGFWAKRLGLAHFIRIPFAR